MSWILFLTPPWFRISWTRKLLTPILFCLPSVFKYSRVFKTCFDSPGFATNEEKISMGPNFLVVSSTNSRTRSKLDPAKLAGHHLRTSVSEMSVMIKSWELELTRCSGWHPEFAFYSPFPTQAALDCCRIESWIFFLSSVWFGKTEVGNTRMEMKFCKVRSSSTVRCVA